MVLPAHSHDAMMVSLLTAAWVPCSHTVHGHMNSGPFTYLRAAVGCDSMLEQAEVVSTKRGEWTYTQYNQVLALNQEG